VTRVKIEGVQVDLLKLTTIKTLAKQLLQRGEQLDAVVWNAGIANWRGLNWLSATWLVLTDLVHTTTYPSYMLCEVGLLAKPQLPASSSPSSDEKPEPSLGRVFAANVFGHYLLTHWLSPLFTPSSKIIWTSSITALGETFTPSDLQGLTTAPSYEGSKRLTDLLVLTSELPSTAASIETFLPATNKPPSPKDGGGGGAKNPVSTRPKMFLTHPGVVGTSIADLHPVMAFFMVLVFYVARWLGSPWHGITPYKGAVAVVKLLLAPSPSESSSSSSSSSSYGSKNVTSGEEIDLLASEKVLGKAKWGSAVDFWGREFVARTEVEGWGFGGKVGEVPEGSVTGAVGRFRGWKEVDEEGRVEFEEMGRRVWREMEDLRGEWEGRLRWKEDEK
jgi:3-keto steroid reductase